MQLSCTLSFPSSHCSPMSRSRSPSPHLVTLNCIQISKAKLLFKLLDLTLRHKLHYSGVLIRHLYVMQIKTWCFHQGEEWISIIKHWRQEGHSVNRNKQSYHITRCRLTSWSRPRLPQGGIIVGVVLCGLRCRDVKRYCW